jgi:hypothetical protein
MAKIELHRIFHGWAQKLTPQASSLHEEASYLLLNYQSKLVQLWIGNECSRIDRALAEHIGDKIAKEEFKISTASHPVVALLQDQEPNSFFLSFFNISLNEYLKLFPSLSPLANDPIYLSELKVKTISAPTGGAGGGAAAGGSGQSGSISLELLQTVTLQLNSAKISCESFSPDSAILFESGSFERYLWMGKKIPRKFSAELITYATNHSQCPVMLLEAPLIQIRDGMEPFLFLEKFKNIQETFPQFQNSRRNSDGGAGGRTAPKIAKRPVDGEVPRMTSSGFGTLSMLSQGLGSDSTTLGLKMDFVRDSSSEAALWKIDGKNREFVLVPETERGIFLSDSCYALLFR